MYFSSLGVKTLRWEALLIELRHIKLLEKCSSSPQRQKILKLEWLTFLFAEVNKCLPNPCQHAGRCTEVVGGSGFACQCITGYKGQRCEGNEFTDVSIVTECFAGKGPRTTSRSSYLHRPLSLSLSPSAQH